jgi:putative ABC transport system permease protein
MSLLKDLRLAVRALSGSPGFTVTAVVTIALGIGASTAVFSVINAVLIRPLPYRSPDQLVIVWSDLRNRHVVDFPLSNPDFADLRNETTAFDGLAAVITGRTTVPAERGRDAEQIRLANVTTNVFSVLGLNVEHGRNFEPSDGVPPPPQPVNPSAAPGALPTPPTVPTLPRIAILSHEFWMRRSGGDLGVIGKPMPLGNGQALVVGVLAPGAELLFPPGSNIERRPDVWTAIRVDFTQGSRNNVGIRAIGRLKSGASVAEAQRQVDVVASGLRRQYQIKQTAGMYFRVEPMAADLVAGVRSALVALMGAVLFVLLIACANVANLLLARSAARERDLAVRAALGAGEWRLVRQVLAESATLAAGGALIGLALARVGIRLLLWLQPENLPRIDAVAIDQPVLLFAIAIAVFAAALFGLVPAVRAARPDVIDVLRQTGRTAGLGPGRWLRNAVVVAEVALSFVLLVGSGLMLRSFIALQHANPGYDPNGLLTFVPGAVQARTPEARKAFIAGFTDRLRAIPGVTGVTAVSPMPLDGGIANGRWGPETAAADPALFQQANAHFVLPGYFSVMHTPLLQGRTFTQEDNNADARVVVIDSMLAARAFPRESPVGKHLLIRIRTEEAETFEVIGVVAHERHESLAEDGREAMFFADGLVGPLAVNRWLLRTGGDPAAVVPALRAAAADFDSRLVLSEIQPMTEFVDRAEAETRFALVLIGVFAAIAAVLVAVGLYGVLSTVVRQRTAEIGVRIAFGAGRRSVFGLIVQQGLRLSAIGMVVGLAGALALTQVLRTLLVDVTPTDPVTFVAIVVLFLGVALLACGLPAFRAARLDPNVALREE